MEVKKNKSEGTLAGGYASTSDGRQVVGKRSIAGFGGSASALSERTKQKGQQAVASPAVEADGFRPKGPLDARTETCGEICGILDHGGMRLLTSSGKRTFLVSSPGECHERKTYGLFAHSFDGGSG